jgi:hypothetical protein
VDNPKLSCTGAVMLVLVGLIASIGVFFVSYFVASAFLR